MVDDIISAVEARLKELCSATVYRFYQPQKFQTPSFLISVTDQNHDRLLRGTFKSKLSLDTQYFSGAKPADIKATRADCLAMQETLLRGFNLIGRFRCTNKDAQIVDNVLHFTFDVKYSERAVSTDPHMEKINLTIKE